MIPRLLLFGARSGHLFADCSADLFLAMHRRGWKCIWLTRRESIQRQVQQMGFESEIIGSSRHLQLLREAAGVVMSSQMTDICDSDDQLVGTTKVVFTGHGKSSKATSLKANYHSELDANHAAVAFVSRRVSVALASSQLRGQALAACYGIPFSKIRISGLPRADKLFDASLRRERLPYARSNSKKILYAPTWRKWGKMAPTLPFGFPDYDETLLLNTIERLNVSLYIRPHIQDERFHPSLLEDVVRLQNASERIKTLASTDVADINNVLADFDALITDYSSIDDDFLLLDRPIAYAPYDYQEFERVQGFIEDYPSTRAGRRAVSFKDVIIFIEQVAAGHDPDKSMRAARLTQVHDFTDGRSTERAIAGIEKTLNEFALQP